MISIFSKLLRHSPGGNRARAEQSSHDGNRAQAEQSSHDGNRAQAEQSSHDGKRGFTLLEMIVATALFLVAMLIIIGSLISLNDASRKARTIRVATDNLSAALDSMSRSIRMGTSYHCGCNAPFDTPANCPMTTALGAGGEVCFAFEGQHGATGNSGDQVVYRLSNGRIQRSKDGGVSYLDLTAPEITIDTLRFFAGGTEQNANQPYVTMVIQGKAPLTAKTTTTFNIQTTIGQRTPNFAP